MKSYLYISPTGNGWENLATDEYLLNHAAPGEMILHLYINENAVIIGQNQNPWLECDLDAMERDSVQLVRRISGGGAVYHDRGNLNFSFITAKENYDVGRQTEIIRRAVASLGIETELSGRNDITAGGRKFSGCAYCQRGGKAQHHGTLMVNTDVSKMSKYLRVSPLKLEAKGVKSVRSRVANLRDMVPGLTVEEVREAVLAAYTETFGSYEVLTPEPCPELYEKHCSEGWRFGASPDFDYRIDGRLSFGTFQLCFKVSRGRIGSGVLYTDSLDTELPEKLQTALAAAVFDRETVANRLEAPCPELSRWIRENWMKLNTK